MSQKSRTSWQLIAPLGSLVLSVIIALTGIAFWFGGFTSSFDRLAAGAVQKAMDDLLGPGTIIPKFELGQAGAPPGWVVCGRKKDTPDLRGRFLIGTTDISSAGEWIGKPGPEWRPGTTGGESRGKWAPESAGHQNFADNIPDNRGVTGGRNWYHEHSLPSVQVVFLCRHRDG